MPLFVQTIAGSVANTVTHGTTGVCTVSVTFPSSVTPGNTIFVAVKALINIGNNTGIGVHSTGAMHVTDGPGNTYTQISGLPGGVQLQAIGIFIATGVLGGSTNITFDISIPNVNPIFDLAQQLAIVAAEVPPLGSPTIQGSAVAQTTSGSTPTSIVIADSFGTLVTTDYGMTSQQSAAVVDLALAGTDYFVSAFTIFTSAPGTIVPPAMLPGGYGTYSFIDAPFDGTNYNHLALFIAAPPAPVCAIEQRGNIDYDQIAIDARHGNGPKVQMFKPTGTGRNILTIDECGNAVDSTVNVADVGSVGVNGPATILVNGVAVSYDNVIEVNGSSDFLVNGV